MASELQSKVEKPAEKRWRKIVQGGWLTLAVLAGIIFMASMLGYLQQSFGLGDGNSLEPVPEHIINSLLSILAAAISLGLAGLLFWRKRDDNMALFLAFFFLLYGVVMAGPLEVFALSLGNDQLALTAQPLLITLVVAPLLTFPKGNFVPAWSSRLLLLAVLLTPAMTLVAINIDQSTPELGAYLTGVGLLILLAVGFYGQIVRYKSISSPQERMQTKWVVYGFGLWILMITISSGPWFYAATLPPDQPTPSWLAPFSALWWVGLMIVPISFTVAVLRNQLWDIDLLIRRTLIYGLLTALLVMIYFAAVVVLQTLFRAATGQQSPAAIVVSTLAIAALFQPLRRWVKGFIDRRFFRSKYDARYALAQFARTVRDEVDLDQISLALLEVVNETLHPEESWLWLRDTTKDIQNTVPDSSSTLEGTRTNIMVKLRHGESDGVSTVN